MALLLKHQTITDFVGRFRAAWRDGTQQRLVRLARFLIASIQAGDITDTQCRTAFGLNTTQWNAIKTKMNNLITADNAILSAIGE